MQDKFEHRYGFGPPNRSFYIADALIFLKSYNGTQIDAAAKGLEDADVAGFHRVVAALNATLVKAEA